MKLFQKLVLVGLGVGTAGGFALQGCSSSSPADTKPGTSTTGAAPAKPSGPATTVTVEHNYAFQKLFLGNTDRNGVEPPTHDAWKKFGYNLDGLVSTSDPKSSPCKLVRGADPKNSTDGDNGIDNAFGLTLLPIIDSVASAELGHLPTDLLTGEFTLMVDTTGIDDSTTTQTATGLTGSLLFGAKFPGTPTFTTADDWPIPHEFLTNEEDPRSSRLKFTEAYINNGTYVGKGALQLNLSGGALSLNIEIKNALMTFKPVKGKGATEGIMAGVINTEQLLAELKKVAGQVSKNLCTDDAFENIAKQLRVASDIMTDGSINPDKECDGISLGIGFEAPEIGPPHTVNKENNPSPPNKCNETGGDAGTGDGG